MAKVTTYLAGAIQSAKDGGVKWRETLTPKLQELGIEVLDPTTWESQEFGTMDVAKDTIKGYILSGNWEKFDEYMDRIIDRDIKCVRKADFLVVFIDTDLKIGGTSCELWEAVAHCKTPVYVVCYDPKSDWNMWLLRTVRRNGQLFENWTQLMDFLTEKYGKRSKRND